MEPLCNVYYDDHEVVFQYFTQPGIQRRMDARKFKEFIEAEATIEKMRV